MSARAMLRTLTMTLGCAAAAWADPCLTGVAYPGAAWPSKVEETKTAKAAAVKALEDYAFTLTGADAERKGIRTDSVVIVKGGALVYERYARGFTETNKHISWSAVKSISSALAGMAVLKGALNLDESICTYVTEYSGKVCDIKVKDVLVFATGFKWQEEYEGKQYQLSSVISMLFGVGHGDNLKHILSTPIAAAPGKQWMYSTGDAGLLATVTKRALQRQKPGDAFPFWTNFFDKLGMDTTLEEDAKGSPQGDMFAYATPRDFARFGFLFLHDGCWNGERLVPEGWVTASTTPSPVFLDSAKDSEDTPSGYMWWLNQPRPNKGKERPWLDVPPDAYKATGHWGQRIYVVPSLDLVVVRMGDDREDGKGIKDNELMKLAMEVAK